MKNFRDGELGPSKEKIPSSMRIRKIIDSVSARGVNDYDVT